MSKIQEPLNPAGVGDPEYGAAQERPQNLCLVCQDEPVSIRLACGHAILCHDCTKRLLETGTNQCPTCRKTFTEYFEVAPDQVGRQASFINPTDSDTNFGTLVRASLTQPSATFQHARQQANQNPSCCGLIMLLVVLLVVVSLSFVSLVLGIVEIKFGLDGRDVHCDRPISPWLIAMGAFHLLAWITGSVPKRNNGESNRQSPFSVLAQVAIVVNCIVGCFFVYPISKSSCDHVMYDYSWYFLTIALSLGALIMLVVCCCGRGGGD